MCLIKLGEEFRFQKLKSTVNVLICRQLLKVLELHQKTGNNEPPIGLLTGTHRDTWSDLYKYMSELDQTNKVSFETIQKALVFIFHS
jgi:hypothetical protein